MTPHFHWLVPCWTTVQIQVIATKTWKYIRYVCIYLQAEIYKALPFYLFGGMSVASGLLILLVPETLNQKLPDTVEEAEMLGKRHNTWCDKLYLFYNTYWTGCRSISQPVARSAHDECRQLWHIDHEQKTMYKYFIAMTVSVVWLSCSLVSTTFLSINILWVDMHLERTLESMIYCGYSKVFTTDVSFLFL